ncbi:MAG: cation diffusion facilitator family transporter [Bacteroidota bacterium]
MEHSHEHKHSLPTSINRSFLVGIALNIIFVIVELGAGFFTGSLALISDAGHNLSDVFSLVLSLVAFRLAKIRPTETFTYGYKKSTILASVINAVILIVAVGLIGWEAIQRFYHPQEISGGIVAAVAGVGILINSFSAFLFFKDKEKDLNIKGAYMHLLADALVSVGVVVAGVIISYTHWFWVDSVISFGIMIVIVLGTWGLLKESLRLSLDAVPKDIDVGAVKKSALAINGVINIHHLHIWATGTSLTSATAHIVVEESLTSKQISALTKKLKHEWDHLGIAHSTIEIETADGGCLDADMNH